MSLTRYGQSNLINNRKAIGTNMARVEVYNASQKGSISTETYITTQGDRLDKLAGSYYNDGTLWWVIAAASGIGWWLQVTPGTVLKIPLDITEVYKLVT